MLPNPALTTYLDLRDGKPQGHRPNLACHLFFVNQVYWNSALAIHLCRWLLSQFKWHSGQNKWVPKLDIFPLWLLTENLRIFVFLFTFIQTVRSRNSLYLKSLRFGVCKFNPWLLLLFLFLARGFFQKFHVQWGAVSLLRTIGIMGWVAFMIGSPTGMARAWGKVLNVPQTAQRPTLRVRAYSHGGPPGFCF